MTTIDPIQAFHGFSVPDIEAARTFYGDVLGLSAREENGMLWLELGGGTRTLVYPKDDHQPATYTVLNFAVADVESTVDELTEAGVEFIRYPQSPQDAKGIMRGYGPDIAWFTDPAGNVLSIIAG
jgi:catechol 2,3-dioxygenase-like lactoylglutathione lyase family enzyme